MKIEKQFGSVRLSIGGHSRVLLDDCWLFIFFFLRKLRQERLSKAPASPRVHLQVAELLKYKMEKSARTKVKRMPTVKKELSTQREILLASNETQVPKSLLPSEDPFNRLSGKTDYVERRSLEGNEVREKRGRDSPVGNNRTIDHSAATLNPLCFHLFIYFSVFSSHDYLLTSSSLALLVSLARSRR